MTKHFFDTVRSIFPQKKLTAKQVEGLEALLLASKEMPITHRAYLLATAMLETAWTMQPIAEYGKGKGRKYGVPDSTGQVPYGRGYVQITWEENYRKADQKLGLNGKLIKNYELALQPDIAAQIIVRGMTEGWFTGKKLSDYLPGDYENARRIVNGMDRAKEIADYARVYESALLTLEPGPRAGLWQVILNLLAKLFGGKK